MYYDVFKKMVEIHPVGESKNKRYNIKHLHVDTPSGLARMQNPEIRGQKEQDVCILRDASKREIVMSDSWMEQETNIDMANQANGDVLIGGLGMGMIILALQEKPDVKSITVVELEQELHDFIMPSLVPYLNDKVKVVISDIHDFVPTQKYDTIYCDIWNDISSDNWEEMKKLTKKFKYKVNRDNPKCSLGHWRKDRTQALVREQERSSYYW